MDSVPPKSRDPHSEESGLFEIEQLVATYLASSAFQVLQSARHKSKRTRKRRARQRNRVNKPE